MKIAVSRHHAVALTHTGEVWTWGIGTFGRLGTGNEKNVLSPQRIDSLKRKPVKDIACSASHTMAVSRDDRLFAWGERCVYG